MGTLSKSTGHLDLVEDETSCGPMCQHPSCWASNQRREKGFPLKHERPPSPPEEDLGLPAMTVYNMLEDYGDDTRDRFPAKNSGRPAHNRLSSSLPALPKSSSQTSVQLQESIPAIMSSSQHLQETKKRSRMKVVEVQEVFDVEDLNNKWDETFITRQYYVWVPNPHKSSDRPKTLDPLKNMSVSKLTSKPQPIPSKDVTEQLIPEELERQREEARVFDDLPVLKKKYTSVHAGMSRGTMHSRGTTQRSARPYVDAESLHELLDLPREILLNVIEHMGESDLASKEKVQNVIKQFQPAPEPQQSPASTSMGTSELLHQKKVRLLGCKEKNQRKPDLLMTKPVFQLDSGVEVERSSEVNTPVKDLASEVESSREEGSTRELSKYKKPLPGIGVSAVSRYDGSAKIASISLGLPELPSGLRQTRPFTYKKQQYVDFSLGPIPTPPVTGRSSESGGSDHGTTLRVNMASASTRLQDQDLYARYSREGTPLTESSLPLHGISPSTSGKLPKTPMVTPATHPSPTKLSFQRERTNASGQNGCHTPPPSRDVSMSPTQKMIAPANSPNQSPVASPEPGTLSLVPIPEILDDGSMRHVSAMGKMVSFVGEVPPPPPASLDEHHTYTIYLGDPDHPLTDTHMAGAAQSRKTGSTHPARERRTETAARESDSRLSQSPVSASSDDWPNVNEAAFENAPYPLSAGLRSTSDQLRLSSAERGSRTSASKTRSSLASRESDKSSVVRIILDESVKTESPGPPPPSPEPKDKKKLAEEKKRQELLSRDSVAMTPLYEESETGETNDQNNLQKYDPGVMTTVSEVTPQPKSGKREISVDTFVNVDIQAYKESPKTAEDTTGQATFRCEEPSDGVSAGPLTDRTVSGGYTTDDGEASPDAPFVLKSPVIEAAGDTSQDFKDNREESEISRETTGLRRETEPESVSANNDIEAVNYDNRPVDNDDNLPESQDHEDEPVEPSTSFQEIKQDSSLLEVKESNDEDEQRGIENQSQTAEPHNTEEKYVNGQASPPEDRADESRGTESSPPNHSILQPQPTQENKSHKTGPEDIDIEPPTFESKKTDGENEASVVDNQEHAEEKDSAIDVNIPPPVSRTNTAIEMVRSVIESATANVDEIIQSGDSPDCLEDSQTE